MKQLIQLLLIENSLIDYQSLLDLIERASQEFNLNFARLDESLDAFLENHRPDLILVSFAGVSAERETGFFEKLRLLNFSPTIPVIVVGTRDTADEAVRYMKMGAADYVVPRTSIDEQFPQKITTLVENQKRQNRQTRTMETLGRITLALNATHDLSKLLDLICQESSQLFGVRSTFIWLVEEEHLVGFAGYGLGREEFVGMRLPLSQKLILGSRVLKEKRPIFVNNAVESADVDQTLVKRFNTKSILGTPLLAGGQAIGALMLLDNQNPRRFEPEDLDLAWLLGSHAAIAINNARLYHEISERVEESNRRSEELETLRQASFHLTANLTLEPLLGAIIEKTMKLIKTTNVHIFLYDGKKLTFGAARWTDGRQKTPYQDVRQNGLTETVARAGKPLIIPNVNEHPLFRNWQWGGGIAAFPLKIGDEVLGVMNIADSQPHHFDDNEKRILNLFADEAAIAIKNAQLFEATRRQLEELSVLHSVALIGVKATEEDTLIEETTRIIGDTFYPHNFGVLLLDETKEKLLVHPSYQLENKTKQVFDVGKGIASQVVRTGEAILADDVEASEFYLNVDPTTRSELCVPLKVGDRIMGVINAESDQIAAFTNSDERLLTTLASQLAIALERLRTENTERRQRRRLSIISNLAREMTGLLNVKELSVIVAERLHAQFGYFNVSIFLVDFENNEVVLQTNEGAYATFLDTKNYRQKIGEGLIGLAAKTGQPQVYNDTREAGTFFTLNRMDILSEAALPLKIGERVIGVLNIDSAEYNTFGSDDIATLLAVADQLAITIEKARLFEETKLRSEDLEAAQNILHERAKELDFLNKVIGAAASAKTTAEVLHIGCKELASFFDVPQAALALLDESRTFETVVAEYLAPGRVSGMHERIPVANNHALQEVLKTGQPFAIENVQNHPSIEATQDLLARRGTVSLLLVPIPVLGRIVGTIGIDAISPRSFTHEELRLVKTVGEELGRALETAQLHEQLQAHADELEARVSERTKALAEANEQLKELDRLKSKFVSDVSHELRTPVANLWLYLDLLERGRPERRDHYLSVLKKETKRLEQLIENTLNLSRIEKTDSSITFEQLDFNELVEQIVIAYQPRAAADNLSLNFNPGRNIRPIQGARNQLAQVINNLLSNAFNYTEQGFVHVRTYSDNLNNHVVLEVVDSGSGIDAEDLPHLFDRFYRGRHTGQSDIPGTGLGLAIAKEIIDLHRGFIEVDSKDEGETIFRVRLPYGSKQN